MATAETLSLADLESHDPHARRGGRESRFRCPLDECAGAKARNVSVNNTDGAWICYKCGAKGKLVDFREEREPWKPQDRRQRQRAALASMAGDRPEVGVKVSRPPARPPMPETKGYDFEGETRQIVKIDGTPAAGYLESRGIPAALASAAGVRYSPSYGSTVWVLDKEGSRKTLSGAPAVVFPMRDADKRLRGICGRVPGPGTFWKDGPNKRTFKADPDAEAGVFTSPPDALRSAAVAVVEAPIDALSLNLCDLATVATVGTGCPEWLLDRLAFRVVFLAHDSDEAGDKAAERIAPELRTLGARPVRLKPPTGTKDWNEALQRFGKDALAEAVTRTIAPYLGTEPPAADVAEVDPFEDPGPPAPAEPVESPYAPPLAPDDSEHAERMQNAAERRTAPKPHLFHEWPLVGSLSYSRLGDMDKWEACAVGGFPSSADLAAVLARIGANQGTGVDLTRAEALRCQVEAEASNIPEA